MDPNDLPLVGYTLKVYRGRYRDKNGSTFHKLGRLRDYGQVNPYEIPTSVINTIGTVIGVYRDISQKGKLTKISNQV